MMNERLQRKIREHVRGMVSFSEPLSGCTTYRVGGAAEALVRPSDSRALADFFVFARSEGLPLTVIGAGSNVIAPDDGIEGVVVKTESASARTRFSIDGRIKVDAGVLMGDLLQKASLRGLGGMEPLACVPGTVGGAVVMNASTREAETAGFVERVEVLTSSGRRRLFHGRDLAFGYRRSIFTGSDWLVLSAELRLRPTVSARSLALIDACWKDRERKYPLDLPSAGSVFKRPPGDYAGRLIEAAGCKGLRIGGAAVSDLHANFIVNLGGATAGDILALIGAVRRRVLETSGVWLELEQIPLCSIGGSGAEGASGSAPRIARPRKS